MSLFHKSHPLASATDKYGREGIDYIFSSCSIETGAIWQGHMNYVIHQLISSVRNNTPMAIPSMLEVVEQISRRGISIPVPFKRNMLRLVMERDIKSAPRIVAILKIGCWEIIDVFYNLGWRVDIKEGNECNEWDSFVCQTLTQCIADKGIEDASLSFNFMFAVFTIDDQWEWPDKTSALDTLFAVMTDPSQLLVMASRCLRYPSGEPFGFQMDKYITRFINSIATWALYGIRQEWISNLFPGHDWLPVDFASLLKQRIGFEVADAKSIQRRENTEAVGMYLSAVSERVFDVIGQEPLSRLIASYCACLCVVN